MARIVQVPLRIQIRNRIAKQLWNGVYSFGEDLNEARLADELGVSRTPLREALVMLASEGLIEALPNRGFHVPAVDPDAVAELYPVLGTLEGLAVASSTGDLGVLAADLARINARLQKPNASNRVRNGADAEWHERLVGNCVNATLRREIGTLRARSRCIDGALFRGLADVEESHSEHEDIQNAIARGDLEHASRRVRDHWLHGIDVVAAWIEEACLKRAAR
jgi:DNA-binding GntR family transcriptional regulator